MDAAKRLLESPDHTVASAMRHVGYTDPASFGDCSPHAPG
jgi:AraC-like DNA-binding protein